MDRPTKPSGRHAVRLRWDEIITRLSYRFNFLAIGDIGNLLTIMNLLGATAEARLPFRWDDRLDLWKKGFSSVPSLQPHKERAVEFLKSIHEAAEDRNYAAHAVWGEFVSDASEPTMMARGIKSGQRGIVVDDRRITLTMVESALAECNRLNLEMSEFTKLMRLLRPPPTGALSL